MKEKLAVLLYRLIEAIDGEYKFRLISYKTAQKMKMYLLTNFIDKGE